MKKIYKVKRCAKCDSIIARNEIFNVEKSLCALCDQMHIEAMDIYNQRMQAALAKPAYSLAN